MKKPALAAMCVALCACFCTVTAHAQIYIPPQCDLSIDRHLRDVEQSVKRAAEARSVNDRTERLAEARNRLFTALEEAQDDVPALWYFLGRYYLLEADYAGADSAFQKVENLVPECAEDTYNHRDLAWAELYNTAVEALQVNELATAKEAFISADDIQSGDPNVPYYLGVTHVRLGEHADALQRFKQAVALEADTGEFRDNHVSALFNVALLHQVTSQWDSSVTWYNKYLQFRPDDSQAIASLATAHLGRGVMFYQRGEFEQAAEAFSSALEKNPFYRDALMNLSQCYYRIARPGDDLSVATLTEEILATRAAAAEGMLATARRLVDLDPQNRSSLRQLAVAYQVNGDQDSLMAVAERMESLPYEISVQVFRPGASGYDVRGVVTNLSEDGETVVPPVTLEFLDSEGSVLLTETIGATTLQPGESSTFQFNPVADGLSAWRCRVP